VHSSLTAMISTLFSRIVIVFLGTLYPAYASYKAIRNKDVKEYVKWMMYWIVFALFITVEMITDVFFAFWFPFYYELKIVVFLWLLSPATEGSSILYRKFVHPTLVKNEQEIDEYLSRAKEESVKTVMDLGTKGFHYASRLIMETAMNGGGGLMNQLRKSYSVGDLTVQRYGGRGGAVGWKADEMDETDAAPNLSVLRDVSDCDMDEFSEPVADVAAMLPSSPRRSKRSSVRITEVIIRPLDATDADSSLGSGGPCDPDGEFQSFLEPMPVEIRRRAGRTTGRSSLRHSATDDIVTASKKPITEKIPSYATLPRPKKKTSRSTSRTNKKTNV